MDDGSGSVPLTCVSGSRRPTNLRIRNTGNKFRSPYSGTQSKLARRSETFFSGFVSWSTYVYSYIQIRKNYHVKLTIQILKLVNIIDGLCFLKMPVAAPLNTGLLCKQTGLRWLAHVVINTYGMSILEYVGAAASPGRAVNPLHELHLPGYPASFSFAS